MTQFSFYLNAYAKDLRSKIVDYEGQKELVVRAIGTLRTFDHSKFIDAMSYEIKKNIKDTKIREWIIPNFSTTTENDTIVASVLMMSSMQKYFTYKFELTCGLPEVTLEGKKKDWIKLLNKAKFLVEFNTKENHMQKWFDMLEPVLEKFIESFDKPDLDFWNKICTYYGGGSGPSYLTGWLATFCYFDKDGKNIEHNKITKESLMQSYEKEYKEKQKHNWMSLTKWFKDDEDKKKKVIDNYIEKHKKRIEEIKNIKNDKDIYSISSWNETDISIYPIINNNNIPSGVAKVPVTIDDNGTKYKTTLFAGQFCYEVKEDTQICPRSDWCLAINPPE